ncbi:hypothetical protein BpHYR1_002025 [Brachionus plicatilis]|uniref:Uncharacterized protein n=1 Tax=Brachionus plicatilis TaxID=10195 RepID=A0A3M7RAJ1_BRAPC|nr:hypothetical protein BpHYR1_002025 [Brachionus plicatilis]
MGSRKSQILNVVSLLDWSSCCKLHNTLPVSTLYTLAVRSQDALATHSPSGNHSAAMHASWWPSKRWMGERITDGCENCSSTLQPALAAHK